MLTRLTTTYRAERNAPSRRRARATRCRAGIENRSTTTTTVRAGRREALLVLFTTTTVSTTTGAAHAAGTSNQPIDWLFKSSMDDDVDLGEIIRAAANGEVTDGRKPKRAEEREENADGSTMTKAAVEESEMEDMDLSATATKFGKLGAILVFADVVTAAVMGKSVLGVAKSLERELEMGEDGKVREVVRERENDGERDWKEEMADKLMQRLKENKQVGSEEASDERQIADEE